MKTFSQQEAKTYYDRFGSKQDTQAYYEDPATDDLVAHAAFEEAQAVFEFGCGTGRFAERLLERYLPSSATYLGVDISTTMVELAQARLRRFGTRAVVRVTDGSPFTDVQPASCDRVVSNFVFDLLPEEDIRSVVTASHRALNAGGLLCLVSLTPGFTMLTRLVAGVVTALHGLRPSLVGGCRPIELLDYLPEQAWHLRYPNKVASYGIPSAVVIAAKR